MALAISLGAMAGWTIGYITTAILQIAVAKNRERAKLSLLLWLICMGIQSVAICVALLVEKLG